MKIKDEIKERATSRTVIPYDIIDMSGKNNLKCKQSSIPQYKTDNVIKCDGKICNKRTSIKCGIPLPPMIKRKRAKICSDKMKCNPNDNKSTKPCTSGIIAITPDKDCNKEREV